MRMKVIHLFYCHLLAFLSLYPHQCWAFAKQGFGIIWVYFVKLFCLFFFFSFVFVAFLQTTLSGNKEEVAGEAGYLLTVPDCLVSFPRPCPPISPVICARLGQSWSRVAMVRDCLHPVMLDSHVGRHSSSTASVVCAPLVHPPPRSAPGCVTTTTTGSNGCAILTAWPSISGA